MLGASDQMNYFFDHLTIIIIVKCKRENIISRRYSMLWFQFPSTKESRVLLCNILCLDRYFFPFFYYYKPPWSFFLRCPPYNNKTQFFLTHSLKKSHLIVNQVGGSGRVLGTSFQKIYYRLFILQPSKVNQARRICSSRKITLILLYFRMMIMIIIFLSYFSSWS